MDRSIPSVALATLAVLVLGTLVVAGATSTSSFDAHNPSWDGTAEFRGLATGDGTAETIRNASTYGDLEGDGTLAVVLSPSEAYGGDAAHLQRFVQRGGTLLVAEDYRPHANDLLAEVGAQARFDGNPVQDERNYESSPELATVSVVDDGRLTGDAEMLVFNRGTVLDPAGETVLARTSRDAYLDLDHDGVLDDSETPAVRPVVSVESVGEGRVITVADPSLFINAMLDRGDNRAFAQVLLTSHDRVAFDVSHAGGLPPLVAAHATLSSSAGLQIVVGTILVAGVAGWRWGHRLVERLRRWGQRPSDPAAIDPAAVARAVARAHPDWEEARVRRVTERVLGERANERQDGPQ